jgi:hypothetical protein
MKAVVIAAAVAAACFGQVVLPEGTKVRVRLEQTMSSATAEEGQPVQLTATEDVKVGDTVVIPQGATAVGSIVQAVPKRRMGRTGKLDFSIERVVASDGNNVPLRYTVTKKEGGSHAARTGALTAGAAVVFWPAAPVFLLMKGKDVTVNKGMVVDVFTDQKFVLQAKAPAPAAQPVQIASAAPAGQPATVKVDADLPGAEIEIDGAFVGSTPATLQLTPGLHTVAVKRGAKEWKRAMQVQPGSSVNVLAGLGK